jgi:hypothetical protein
MQKKYNSPMQAGSAASRSEHAALNQLQTLKGRKKALALGQKPQTNKQASQIDRGGGRNRERKAATRTKYF